MPNVPYRYEPPWADYAERECRDCGKRFMPESRLQNICRKCSEWHEMQKAEDVTTTEEAS